MYTNFNQIKVKDAKKIEKKIVDHMCHMATKERLDDGTTIGGEKLAPEIELLNQQALCLRLIDDYGKFPSEGKIPFPSVLTIKEICEQGFFREQFKKLGELLMRQHPGLTLDLI